MPTASLCNEDTVIGLYDANFALRAIDDEGGVNSCSRILSTRPGARLAPGNYWVGVFEFNGDVLPAYQLVVRSVPLPSPAPTLEIEPNDFQAVATPSGLAGPGTVQLQGRISPEGDDDVFSITIAANQTRTLSARTYDMLGMPTACEAQADLSDTRIFVETAGVEVAAPMGGELAFNDDVGASQWCSSLTGVTLAGGTAGATYFVRVQGYEDSGAREYFLQLQLQ